MRVFPVTNCQQAGRQLSAGWPTIVSKLADNCQQVGRQLSASWPTIVSNLSVNGFTGANDWFFGYCVGAGVIPAGVIYYPRVQL